MIKTVIIQILLTSTLLIAFSCEKDNMEQAKSTLLPCNLNRKTIKAAQNAKGRISILDVQHPDTWVIVSEEGVIGQSSPIFDGPDIVVVCNMPESLKIYDLKVIFSGKLRDSGNDFKSGISKIYYSDLTKLQTLKN
jgi:hypothetical protein